MKSLRSGVARAFVRFRALAAGAAEVGDRKAGGGRKPTVEPETDPDIVHPVPAARPLRRRRQKKRDLAPISQTETDLKYRFGFIAHSPNFNLDSSIPDGWRTEQLGNYVVRLHAETIYFAVPGAAVIGPVVGRGGLAIEVILNALLTAPLDRFGALLGDLVGRFAVIVVRDGGALVFNDAFGSRTLFYTTRFPGVVASHSALLADAVGAAPDDAVRNFMKTRSFTGLKVKYLPGDLTLYREVYGLVPNNCYHMAGRTERYWPLTQRATSDRESFFSLLDQSLEDLARLAASRSLILGITGGADSRLICAGLVRHGKPFDGVTWVKRSGGYLPDHERPAVDQTVAMLALRHHYMDVDGPLNARGVVCSINAGRLRGSSTLASGMSAITSRDGVFVRGYGGEIIRGFYNIQRDPMGSASPEEFARMYRKRRLEREPLVSDAFEAFWERANWSSVAGMGYDANDIFYWEHRMGMWGAMMLNYMDAGVESWVGLNSRPLYEAAFGLPPEERLTKALFAEAIARFHKPLADVPIYLQGGAVLGPAGASLS